MTGIFFLCLAAFVLLAFNDYGITYDEPRNHEYGRLLWRFYLSGFHDRGLFAYHDLKIYGGLFEMIAWPLCHLFPMDDYATRHLLNASVGALGIVACFKVGMLLGGFQTALWSALLLMGSAQYLGHMFNNPKDIPYAVGYIWSLYYILCAYRESPGVSGKTLVKLGLAVGLTLGIRAGGVILIGIFGIAQIAGIVMKTGENRGRAFLRLLAQVGVVMLVAWPIMAIFWPYAMLNPIEGPYEALTSFSRFPWRGNVLFGGQLHPATDLPADYILRLLALQLPEISLFALAGGAAMGAVAIMSKKPRLGMFVECLVIAIAIAAPVLYVIIMKSVLYNGMRHFLFIIPPISCLAGLALARLVGNAFSLGRLIGPIVLAAVALALLSHAGLLARLHPHEIAYFNRLAGGLPGAFNQYELDYWGNSYRELVDQFLAQYRREREGTPRACRIYIAGPYKSARIYLPEYCWREIRIEKADFAFYLVNTSPPAGSARVYAVVERFGVPLAYAFDRRLGKRGMGD